MENVKAIQSPETIVRLKAICLRETPEARMDHRGWFENLRTASLEVPLTILHPLVLNRENSAIFHQTTCTLIFHYPTAY